MAKSKLAKRVSSEHGYREVMLLISMVTHSPKGRYRRNLRRIVQQVGLQDFVHDVICQLLANDNPKYDQCKFSGVVLQAVRDCAHRSAEMLFKQRFVPPYVVPHPDGREELFEHVCQQHMRELIHEMLRHLPQRYKDVVVWHLGLDGKAPRTLLAIAEKWSLSAGRVGDMYARAVRDLRNMCCRGYFAPAAQELLFNNQWRETNRYLRSHEDLLDSSAGWCVCR